MTTIPYSNPTTSRAAAQSIEPELGRLEYVVLTFLKFHGVGTCEQLERWTGLSHQSCSARLRGLVLKHLVEDSGETMLTSSKRSAILWRLSAPAKATQLEMAIRA